MSLWIEQNADIYDISFKLGDAMDVLESIELSDHEMLISDVRPETLGTPQEKYSIVQGANRINCSLACNTRFLSYSVKVRAPYVGDCDEIEIPESAVFWTQVCTRSSSAELRMEGDRSNLECKETVSLLSDHDLEGRCAHYNTRIRGALGPTGLCLDCETLGWTYQLYLGDEISVKPRHEWGHTGVVELTLDKENNEEF